MDPSAEWRGPCLLSPIKKNSHLTSIMRKVTHFALGNDNSDRSAGLLAKGLILTDTHCIEILLAGWGGGLRVRLSPRTCNGQPCLLYFKWQLCIFRANKRGGESEGSTTQTDRAHISLVCPLRLWRQSIHLPLERQAAIPSCFPHLHLSIVHRHGFDSDTLAPQRIVAFLRS